MIIYDICLYYNFKEIYNFFRDPLSSSFSHQTFICDVEMHEIVLRNNSSRFFYYPKVCYVPFKEYFNAIISAKISITWNKNFMRLYITVYHHTLSSYPCDVQWISPDIFLNSCYEEFARQLWTVRVSIWCLSQTFRLMVLPNIQDAKVIGFHLAVDFFFSIWEIFHNIFSYLQFVTFDTF